MRDKQRFKRDMKEQEAAMRGFQTRVRNIGTGLQGAGKRMTGFGTKMSRGVTLPTIAAGVASFKMAADFDDSMSKIVGLVGISRRQVDSWKGDILALSNETGKSPQELADAMFFVTSAGLRGKTALDALSASAKASDAGLGETKTVADAVTSAMNAYGPGVLSATKATDILTAAVREGKVEASALAPVIGGVLPMAKAAGIGFEQVAGAMALMSKSGTDASRGATQVTAILGTFQKPTRQMVLALDEMGMSVDDVRTMLQKKGLVNTLDTLRKGAKKTGVDLSQIFGNKRAITGVLQLTGNLKETKDVMRGVRNSSGSMQTAFQEAQTTAKDKLADALNSLKVTAIKLGAALGPVVTPMIEKFGTAIGDGADKFSRLSKGQKTAIVGTILFFAALGPTLAVLGFFTTGVGKLFTGLSLLVKGFKAARAACILMRIQLAALWVWSKMVTVATALWSAAQAVLNFVMSMNPIALVVIALVALAAGFVLAYKKVGWFRKGVQAVWGWIKANWPLIVSILLGPLGIAVVQIIKHWDTIKNGAVSAFRWVKNAASNTVNFFKGLPGKIGSVASGMFDGVKNAFRSALNWIISRWNSLEFKIPGFDPPGPGPKFGGFTLGVPDIPMLADGGFIRAGRFGSYITGERGPELQTVTPTGIAVQPLNSAPGGALAASGGGPTFVVHKTFLDGRQIAETVGEVVRDKKARQ